LLAERDLLANGDIAAETVDYYGKQLKHITADRDPDLSEFSEEELAVIEGAIRRYGHESAAYLSELSHHEVGCFSALEASQRQIYVGVRN
jgi:hypothetical protein